MARNYNHCFFRIELNPSDKKKNIRWFCDCTIQNTKKKNAEENMMPTIVFLHDKTLTEKN